MTQFTWDVERLDRQAIDGMVLTAHWRVTATDGQHSATAYGTIALPPTDPSTPNFVPYEQITKDLAIEWVKGSMGAEQVAAHECALQSQIDTQKAPVITSGTPWQ